MESTFVFKDKRIRTVIVHGMNFTSKTHSKVYIDREGLCELKKTEQNTFIGYLKNNKSI